MRYRATIKLTGRAGKSDSADISMAHGAVWEAFPLHTGVEHHWDWRGASFGWAGRIGININAENPEGK